MKTAGGHLWLALSPHGFGHAAMTSGVIDELRRRRPGLRLTIQTALPPALLEARYARPFEVVGDIPDFGFRMISATAIDYEASAAAYRALHADWEAVVAAEAARLKAAAPDVVLANVPYAVPAAAARAGIPAVVLSCLEWADIYDLYFTGRPEAATISAAIRAGYESARVFLRCLPAMDMTLANCRDIGPIGRIPQDRRGELRTALGLGPEVRIGLIAFGGIDHDMNMADWPRLPGWHWMTTLVNPPDRADMCWWEAGGMAFSDLIASADALVSKPGYGTFTEAAYAGTPVLYLGRPNWPECPHLDIWLAEHGRCREVPAEDLLSPRLAGLLESVMTAPAPPRPTPTGNAEAADVLESILG
jgi:hypothetical protein